LGNARLGIRTSAAAIRIRCLFIFSSSHPVL
jgi:hypothetical protein